MNIRRRVVGEGHLDGAVVAHARVAATCERTTAVEDGVDLVAPVVVRLQIVGRLGQTREPEIEVGAFRERQIVDVNRHAIRGERVALLEERGVERVAGELNLAALGEVLLHPSGELERVVVLLIVVPDAAVGHHLEGRDLFGLLGVARVAPPFFLAGVLLVRDVLLLLDVGLAVLHLLRAGVDGRLGAGRELLGLDDPFTVAVRALRQHHSADDQHDDADEPRDDLRDPVHCRVLHDGWVRKCSHNQLEAVLLPAGFKERLFRDVPRLARRHYRSLNFF